MNVGLNTTGHLPQEWNDWVTTNMMRGVHREVIVRTLKKNRFSDAQIEAAMSNEISSAVNDSKPSIRRLPNKWKEWVASNLLKEASKESIEIVLAQQGYNNAEIALELETASKSPYLQAGIKAVAKPSAKAVTKPSAKAGRVLKK